MKKLLALLLALLLPGLAAAETYGLSVSLDVDSNLFSWYAKQALQGDASFSSEELNTIVSVAEKVIDGAGLDIAVQDNAASLKVKLAGQELLSIAIHAESDAVYLTSPMLSGYTLKGTQQESGSVIQAMMTLFSDEKRQDLGESLRTALNIWLADIEPTTSSGVFKGDAYEGGTQCTAWYLTDMDIAALVSAMATDELRMLVSQMLTSLSLDADSILSQFDAANDQVADEDRFIYVLRWITDDAGAFVGASLTVIDGEAQVATVSLGLTNKSIKIVVGLGLKEQNYWFEFSGKQSQLRNITYLSGESREWIADKAESFSYVSATNAPVEKYMLRGTVTKSGNRYMWDGNISVGDESNYEYVCSSMGTYYPKAREIDCSISLGDAPYEPLTVKVRYGLVDEIEPLDSSLATCSISDPSDTHLCEDLLNQFAASVMARLIRLLPMDLIMTLNQFSLPQ